MMSIADDPVTGDEQGFAAFTRQASTVSEVEAIPTVAQDPIQTFVGVVATGLVSAATSIVNLLLSPFLAASPLGPAQPLTLWEILGWLVAPDQALLLQRGAGGGRAGHHPRARSNRGEHPARVQRVRPRWRSPEVRGGDRRASNGTVTIDKATGTFTYDPVDGYTGPDEFTVEVSDDTSGWIHFHGLSSLLGFRRAHTDTATITLNVVAANDPNDPPVAVDDTYATTEDVPLVVAAPGALGNDTDPDGDVLTASVVTDPTNGTLTLNPPAPSPTPPTRTSPAPTPSPTPSTTKPAHSNPPPSPSPSPRSTTPRSPSTTPPPDEDTAGVAITVLANDTDAENATPSPPGAGHQARPTAPSDGQPRRARSPTPRAADFTGTDTFTYTVNEGGRTATRPRNRHGHGQRPRQRRPDRGQRRRHDRRGHAGIDINVLANDADIERGRRSSYALGHSRPANGTVAVNGDGRPPTRPSPISAAPTPSPTRSPTAASPAIPPPSPSPSPQVNDARSRMTTPTPPPRTPPVAATACSANDTDADGDTLTVGAGHQAQPTAPS